MQWTESINRVAGVALLLLSLGIIISVAADIGTTEKDPFERDEVAEFLTDIHDNREVAIVGTAADVVTDAALSIVAAAALYLVFRERSRVLAMFTFALILGGSVAFMAADAAQVSLIVLAEDFAEKGGAGGIPAGDESILEIARALALWAFTIEQVAFTAIGVGLISLGVLIAWTSAGAGPAPPRWLGGLGVFAGLAVVFSWIGAATDIGIVLFIIGALAMLLFLIILGVWLLFMAPEDGQPAAATM